MDDLNAYVILVGVCLIFGVVLWVIFDNQYTRLRGGQSRRKTAGQSHETLEMESVTYEPRIIKNRVISARPNLAKRENTGNSRVCNIHGRRKHANVELA